MYLHNKNKKERTKGESWKKNNSISSRFTKQFRILKNVKYLLASFLPFFFRCSSLQSRQM